MEHLLFLLNAIPTNKLVLLISGYPNFLFHYSLENAEL